MDHNSLRSALKPLWVAVVVSGVFLMGSASGGLAAEPASSYSPVVIKESFATIMERMKKEKPKVTARQMELLNKRYDLSNRPAKEATMTKGKAVQEGSGRNCRPARPGKSWRP